MLTTYQRQAKIKLITAAVTLAVIAGVVMLTDAIKPKTGSTAITLATNISTNTSASQPATTSSSTTPSSSSTSTSSSSSNTSGYKDGTYSTSTNYFVPHGSEIIQVSLILNNGVITNASIQNSESNPTSAQYQESFASVYKSSVVGKKISGLRISNIGGASDTTQGFDDALNQITSKAQA